VDMSEQLVRALRRLEIDRMVEKVKRGWRELPPWVFCTDEGTPLDESRVRKAFGQALRRAKLPTFRLYDHRHTYASLLLAQNAPLTTWARSSATPTPRRRSAGTLAGSLAPTSAPWMRWMRLTRSRNYGLRRRRVEWLVTNW